jgi:PIN domain nuclease of toxin-antitoxin system
MKIILDTHIFLWFISADKRLPNHWKTTIQDRNSDVYLSVVSLWEVIIKYKLGKLPGSRSNLQNKKTT